MRARAVSRRDFIEAYERGDPVGVTLPGGGLYGIVGFVMHETGISFMDDACLDDMPTRHADHHLSGTPAFAGPDIFLQSHRFHALEGEPVIRSRRMFRPRSVEEARKQAEKRLRELLADRR